MTDMHSVFVCDYIRTPIGRYAGALSSVRADDLASIPITHLVNKHASVDWDQLDEVILGAANQSGEDNRNIARMATLLSPLSTAVPGFTVNRLCASGMDAVIAGYRQIRVGEADLIIAGGSESMSRAPFVLPKAATAFSRQTTVFDTTIGWRFINPKIETAFGVESMPETAENVAKACSVARAEQDRLALSSQQRAAAAIANGRMAREIVPVEMRGRKGQTTVFEQDEHPRQTSLEKLAALKTPFRQDGSVTAGNASGVNDGSAALLLASAAAVRKFDLSPLAEIRGAASSGVAPRIMGLGPVDSTKKLCARLDLKPEDFDLIELNEAFAAQTIAVCKGLKLDPFSAHINPNGGAIAFGHPLGMTGARLVGTAAVELSISGKKTALCSLCVGVGQGVSLMLSAF